MKTIIRLFFMISLLISANFSFSQKIESDGFVIEIKKDELIEQDMGFLGKQKMIVGVATITYDKKDKDYRFYVPLREDTIVDVAMRDMKDKELFPKMWYNAKEKMFKYDDKQEVALKTSDYKEIILSGILIWARLKNK